MRKALVTIVGLSLVGAISGCGNNAPINPCVDEDGDGYDSCQDCDDSDSAVHPDAQEICGNGIDDNCNGDIDERCTPTDDGGTTGDCTPGETRACGEAGGACIETCAADATWGGCQLPSGPVDTATDPANCGVCGLACPTPVHAAASCEAGVCGRSACEPGWFDLDGDGRGCRWSCTATSCTDGESTVQVTRPPLPETGAVFQAFSSGSSWGEHVQTGANYTNFGVLGEPTPPGVGGAVEQTGERFRNVGGLNAIQPQ